MIRRLAALGELSKETVFIDGTKLEACASKYTFVWKKSVGKWEENERTGSHLFQVRSA
jgi:transposase